jgi:VWFA-related protein
MLSGSLAFAQRPTPSTAGNAPHPSVAAPASGPIRIDVQVTTKAGQPIPGLAQSEFTFLDNNKPITLTSFRELSRTQKPVEAILLFDAVNAPFSTLSYERIQIEKFLRSNDGKLAIPFTIAILTDTGVQTLDGYTQDGNALAQSVETNAPGLREINRSAGFWGADERLDTSLKAAGQVIEYASHQPGRKLLLWVSPGWPLLSGPDIQLDSHEQNQIFSSVVSFSTSMRLADLTFYSLNPVGVSESLLREDYYQSFLKGVAKPNQTDLADLSAQVLALQSGGLTVSSTDIGGMIRKAVSDAESWYELTFPQPEAEHPNEYHHLTIKVDRPGAIVRTRDGYYTNPQPK